MQIAFITDLHTGLTKELPFDVDVRQNFLKIIEVLKTRHFDLLVLGGDLCLHDGNAEIYTWQKRQLDSLGKPYYVIPGNHDNQILLGNVFSKLKLTGKNEIYYDLDFEQIALLFLDTGSKVTSDQQKSWLKTKLDLYQKKQILIFMHHPPALMGVPFMDREHALIDRAEILSLFLAHPNFLHVFSGHYHVERSLFIKNVAIHITPSLYIQIDPFVEDFRIDHRLIGFRMIQILDLGLRTSVHYLEG
ncbi:MAG: metallophosphoesterase [Saprospiraceae bacterium]|nr:metallophosphoesterase [Saprospiraceae bacterium]